MFDRNPVKLRVTLDAIPCLQETYYYIITAIN